MVDSLQINGKIAQAWFSSFSKVCETKDVDTLIGLLLPDGWFRDLLTFTWDVRSRHGHEEIKAYLSDSTFAEQKLSDFAIDERPGLRTSSFPSSGKPGFGVEFAFTFETSLAWGRGFVRLLPSSNSQNGVDESSPWKAQSVMMMVSDWKGHEEQSYESGIYDGHNLSWDEVQKQRRELIESNPQVVIRELLKVLFIILIFIYNAQSVRVRQDFNKPLVIVNQEFALSLLNKMCVWGMYGGNVIPP